MNWFQKISSVTFSLEQSGKIAQPKTISRLSNEFLDWAEQNVPRYLTAGSWRMIDMDGLDVDALTGTINWYYQPEANGGQIPDKETELIPIYMKQWIQEELAPFGYQTRIRGPEPSNSYEELNVYRLDILNNPTQDYPSMPGMTLANDNAKALFMMLHVPFDWTGSIELAVMKQRLQGLSDAHMREFTKDPHYRPPDEEQKEYESEGINEEISNLFSGGGAYYFGRNFEQLQQYISELKHMVDFGLRNGFKKMVWY